MLFCVKFSSLTLLLHLSELVPQDVLTLLFVEIGAEVFR